MPERIIPQQPDEFRNGMNNVDNIKKLSPNVLNYLHNAYPDRSIKPLHGVKDIDSRTYYDEEWEWDNIVFNPTYTTINVSGHKQQFPGYFTWYEPYDKDFLFVVVQQRESDNVVGYYAVEIWDLSDGTLVHYFSFRFSHSSKSGAGEQANRVYFNFTKKYNSVYLNMNQAIISDLTIDYDDANINPHGKIFEYDKDADTWSYRSNSISATPIVDVYEAVSSTSTDFQLETYPAESFYSAAVHNNILYRTGGYGGGWGFDDIQNPIVYKTLDSGEWAIDSVLPTDKVVGGQLVSFSGGLYFFEAQNGDASYGRVVYKRVSGVWSYYTTGPWSNREGFSVVVYNDKMWLIGGRYSTGVLVDDVYYNHVYNSSDGVTWNLVTSSAIPGTSGVGYVGMTVYDGKMWISGGVQWDGAAETLTDNSYYSTDGITWALAGSVGYAEARYTQGLASFKGYMWLFGGQDWSVTTWDGEPHNDVYYSSDGITWTLATAEAYGTPANKDTPVMMLFYGRLTVVNSNNSISSLDGFTWDINSVGLSAGKYYSYTFTYIRRTDYDSKLQADHSGVEYELKYTNWQDYKGSHISAPDEMVLSGTVSVSGNSVTGTTTAFDTELSEGDYVRIGGSSWVYKVTTITNATTMVIANSNAAVYTASPYAIVPANKDSITTQKYHPGDLEGTETIGGRALVFIHTNGFSPVITFEKRHYIANVYDGYADPGIEQGATHIRVYRTLGHTDPDIARGLDHRFLVDVSIQGFGNIKHPRTYFFDTTTDTTLSGSLNFLEVTGYSPVPYAKHCVWANNTMWLSGVTSYKHSDNDSPAAYDEFEKYNGYLYHSVPAGTPGVSFDVSNPQKFGSMFNLNKYLACDPGDGQKDTGLAVLEGDLYFFKEQSIYVVYNSDSSNVPVLVNSSFGCICPNSICLADVPVLGGKVLFFISGEGMAYIRPGGATTLFTDFKISYLEKDGGIIQRSKTANVGEPTDFYSRSMVACSFWDNTLWVVAGDYTDDFSQINEGTAANGRNVVFGYHFSIDGESNGVFIRDFTTIRDLYEPRMIIPVDNIRAYTFSNRSEFKLTRFQDPTQYVDTIIDSATPTNYSNNIKLITRAYASDLKQIEEWLAKLLYVYIDFNDEETFTIKLYSDVNKQVATCSFIQERISGTASGADFQYRDFVTIKTGGDFRHAFYHHFELTKQIPSDGSVEIHGVKLIVDTPQERQSPEHMDSFGAATNVTFVVESDTDPEVDAHV